MDDRKIHQNLQYNTNSKHFVYHTRVRDAHKVYYYRIISHNYIELAKSRG